MRQLLLPITIVQLAACAPVARTPATPTKVAAPKRLALTADQVRKPLDSLPFAACGHSAKTQGYLRLRFHVTAEGSVSWAEIVPSPLPSPKLDVNSPAARCALNVLKKLRFTSGGGAWVSMPFFIGGKVVSEPKAKQPKTAPKAAGPKGNKPQSP